MKKILIGLALLGAFYMFSKKGNEVDEGTENEKDDGGGEIMPEQPDGHSPLNPFDNAAKVDNARDKSDSGTRLNPGGGGGPLPVLGPFLK